MSFAPCVVWPRALLMLLGIIILVATRTAFAQSPLQNELSDFNRL
jgi:hypothetical protein